MSDGRTVCAELVMRRADGRSILDLGGAITAAAPERAAGDLPAARIAEIRERLEAAGFTIEGGNANTLSISGTADRFLAVFGLDPDRGAQATHIRDDLAPYVADVFIPPPPEFFP